MFRPASYRCMDPVTATIIIGGLAIGASASQAHQQSKAMKSATAAADAQQQRSLAAAEEQSNKQDATSASAISRARQKALASATAATGRASTIKTGSGGLIGSAPSEAKNLIGE